MLDDWVLCFTLITAPMCVTTGDVEQEMEDVEEPYKCQCMYSRVYVGAFVVNATLLFHTGLQDVCLWCQACRNGFRSSPDDV
jgi:hypothetical protein